MIKTILLSSLIAMALIVGLGSISQVVKVQSQQKQIDKLTEQAKKLS